MPARLKYGFLCDGAMRVHGKFTYQGLFDRINSPQFPAGTPEACLCFKFSGPVGPQVVRIRLVDSQGNPIGKEHRQAIECREFIDTEIVVTYKPLVLPKAGFYSYQIYLNEETEPFGVVDLQGFQMVPQARPPAGGEQ